ncbi:hypothetical protein Tco_0420546 [Tanacetum coccineum]
MVELVNQRKKHFAEERARAKRNKPMTQSQLRTYMMNYLKNQGTWKLSQLKNLSFVEVKEEFDKLVKQVESFVPINFEATKDSLKRFGEEFQTKTSKRLNSDEAKGDESTKKTGKRRKQIARKGLHTYLDKDDSEDSDEASEQDDSASGTKIPINPILVAMKSSSIDTYKIIKQGKKGVFQIVREDRTDIVYINFRAMLKDITRDDLTELYRIVMNRYGMNGPEDKLGNTFWEYLKNIVHCLNLESMDIYMLIERQYPLSAESTMSNKHKDWLVQEQTALGKDFSNPLMADNFSKIVWLSTHHISPVLWAEIGGSSLIGPELVQETTDKVVLVKEKPKAVRDRQKSYADKRRKPLEFKVGDRVLLRVSPWKGVMRFKKKGKLASRYVGPFEILKRIDLVAYRLKLLEELNSVHDTFHVSNIKKCLADANLHVPLYDIKVDKTLSFVKEPIEIMDREIKKLKRYGS